MVALKQKGKKGAGSHLHLRRARRLALIPNRIDVTEFGKVTV
jgi:hypothetical protein